MSQKTHTPEDELEVAKPLLVPIKRRSFFMYAGATAGATALLLSGCDDDDNNGSNSNLIDVGSGDNGVLNYAYALEQLEAAFYTQVLGGGYYAGANAAEKQIFLDIALHEKIHADFFKTALGNNAIPALTPDFSAINFADRTSVLNYAKAFEDLGVAAYNGAGRFIENPAYLTLAGKIVSVEARHAALVRDLLSFNSFITEDIVDFSTTSATARQEKSKTPAQVLESANLYLASGSKLSANSLK
ncbi:ferritin-like domain-containing protein [Hymenobacter crusticola]|uniref:Tat (Twin-arginine translocation) pathway signal sequence containing protein n=1 Tax=Hymenobacter crusticola TaxID=1770526 RepID=A0A243WHI8_9BACT|nr:ferritin-like domain-containing protein [Hymenobacter crusticola]OUJ75311.1 Tat (twin-arginine translocation) pathway signal sequence containing protein [Hymenobacter crusticola]